MSMIAWLDKKTKNFKVWDFSVLKLCCVLIGMIIGAYAAAFVKTYLWYIVGVAIVLMIYLMKKFFK